MKLYDDYPVTIDEKDISDNLKIDLNVVLAQDKDVFLHDVHYLIYDFCIYVTGQKRLKNRIIEKYKEDIEKDLKKILLRQAAYLLENDGGVSKWNGLIKNVSGSVEATDIQTVYARILSAETLNGLMGLSIPLMYAGG